VKQKIGLKDKRKLRTQINGRFNDEGSADENKLKISLQSLYLKTIKRQYIYSSIDDSGVVLVFERNNAGLKKLPSYV
jgi:hypothetical protein